MNTLLFVMNFIVMVRLGLYTVAIFTTGYFNYEEDAVSVIVKGLAFFGLSLAFLSYSSFSTGTVLFVAALLYGNFLKYSLKKYMVYT